LNECLKSFPDSIGKDEECHHSQSPKDTACSTVPGDGIRVFPAQAAAMIVEEPAGNLLPLGLILFAVL